MIQIAYFSTAAEPQTPEKIHHILATARIANREADISGLLVAGGNRYLQVLEGPRDATERLYGSICADQRHLSITTLLNEPIHQRCFEGWAMAFRSAPALGQFNTFPDLVRYLAEQVDDGQLRSKIRNLARVFIAHPPQEGSQVWRLAS